MPAGHGDQAKQLTRALPCYPCCVVLCCSCSAPFAALPLLRCPAALSLRICCWAAAAKLLRHPYAYAYPAALPFWSASPECHCFTALAVLTCCAAPAALPPTALHCCATTTLLLLGCSCCAIFAELFLPWYSCTALLRCLAALLQLCCAVLAVLPLLSCFALISLCCCCCATPAVLLLLCCTCYASSAVLPWAAPSCAPTVPRCHTGPLSRAVLWCQPTGACMLPEAMHVVACSMPPVVHSTVATVATVSHIVNAKSVLS